MTSRHRAHSDRVRMTGRSARGSRALMTLGSNLKAEATVQWCVARPGVSLMRARDKDSNARVTVAGGQADEVAPRAAPGPALA